MMFKETKQRPNGSRWWPNQHNLMSKRWRLRHSPAGHNDYYRVELLGLGNRQVVEVLAELVRSKAPIIWFLMETTLNVREMEQIKVKLDFQSMLVVSSKGRRGGLALLLKTEVVVDTNTFSSHHIDAHVIPHSGQPWRLIGMYGYFDKQQKSKTWRLLCHLCSRSTLPWVCLGDYNEILSFMEKNEGLPKPLPPMLEFRSALLFCGLIDLGYSGYRYTWQNGQDEEAFVEERLDRVRATVEWSKIHPRAKVTYLSASYSDHDSVLLDTTPTFVPTPRRQHKLHRFEERWAFHPECEQVIQNSWT